VRAHEPSPERSREPSRDSEIARALRGADLSGSASPALLRRLNDRIVAAAMPLLEERAAQHRTMWDYTERWSGMLLPLGALAALAAGFCLFMLSAQRDSASEAAAVPRVALLGAATNRVSSQNLVDLLVSNDTTVAHGRRRGR
jgi:hypothetical protein